MPPSETTESFSDALSDLIRRGARQIIAETVEAELQDFLSQYRDCRDEQGRQVVVRNGYLPERTITTGVGEVEIQVPKVRDRSGSGIKFTSALLPPYLKRARRVEELLPWLYLKGVSSGDFSEALSSLLGSEAKGLSPATIGRLKAKWSTEHQNWQQRSLRQQRYVYIWADGIYFNIRADERQCMLVIIGVTDKGQKELLGLDAGYRESELSWKALLLQLKDQGLTHAPQLAIGDGALGFWKALPQVFPTTKSQRCWVHKTANVLNKLPKRQQSEAKRAVWEIYRANSKTEANQAFNSLQLIGNLGADPEVRYFESGSNVAKFTLYLNERYSKDGQTQERTHRFTVETWGKTAEFAANYLRKGSRVAIQGSLTENTWADSDNQNHSRVIVRANRIENLTPKKAGEPQAAAEEPGDDEF